MPEEQDFGSIETPHEENIARVCNPSMDALLGRRIRVLDDGFVRVVDYLGGDESIVQAARVSYGKGTRKLHEDRGLIRYLMRHHHATPFEMCEIKLHVRVPMDTWRQWIRHRTASINEYSTRYSIAINRMQQTAPGDWRVQARDNRQGSEGFLEEKEGSRFTEKEAQLQKMVRDAYDERIECGIAREQARKDLPLSTYTEAYWKIDLRNLLHFLGLRMTEHAQYEIRRYARTIGYEIVAKWVPLVWEAFLDYQFHAVHFSALEAQILRLFLARDPEKATELAQSFGWLPWDKKTDKWKSNREREEFVRKMRDQFGFKITWRKPK